MGAYASVVVCNFVRDYSTERVESNVLTSFVTANSPDPWELHAERECSDNGYRGDVSLSFSPHVMDRVADLPQFPPS